MQKLRESMLDLIVQTSTNLPSDVRRAIVKAAQREQSGSRAAQAMEIILQNIDVSFEERGAICQDTGMPTFKVYCPIGIDQVAVEEAIRWAVGEATRIGKLRPNSVDSLTGKNSGNGLSDTTPIIFFKQHSSPNLKVRLLLKGGGSENKSVQYSLPATLDHLGSAGRDLAGVKKCILHAVWAAQGQGCAGGFLGIGIGSDRGGGYLLAKEQFFRELDDVNSIAELAKLEDEIMEEANTLNIGPMGFGGAGTILGCKIGVANRVPASFFVTVAYNCWAFRRLGVEINPSSGEIISWEQNEESPAKLANAAGFPTTGKEVRLTTPISEDAIRQLHVGDVVLLNGRIVTGRDAMHKYLISHDAPTDLQGTVIYHCGPVMLKDEKSGQWSVQAAGPTTSIREEPYQAAVLEKFGIRGVIGKGGMGAKTLEGLRKSGAVYFHAIGGAAQIYAKTLRTVKNVYMLEEFGVPEAMWEIECIDFPVVVTMDSHGGSLHKDVEEDSAKRLKALAK